MAKSFLKGGISNTQIVFLVLSLLIIGVVFFTLKDTNYYALGIGIGILIGVIPFVTDTIKQTNIEHKKEQMFLEFSKDLVESVKTGTPISKSIANMEPESYGILSQYIKKLKNQISLGVPLTKSLKIFANDVNNKSISRALTLIGQAEKAGGDIGTILESVAGAVNTSDKLKKERKSSISALVVQGYIIFFVFIIIILVMQFQVIPIISGIAGTDVLSSMDLGAGGGTIDEQEISSAFLYLLLIQGLFTGLTIGKLSEGDIKPGIKHSFALMAASFIISTLANLLFG
ncbi:MAG TPA: type II secretion system F family protein [Candidatus Nanoarchaeia archaeon]|nr:type II secretion system F family protein [Candidatus Nanoarchaeia archaeon]